MKRWIFACLALLLVVGFSRTSLAARQTQVEILYMNHGPLMDTLDRIKGLLPRYGDKIHVSWYDYESEQGERFKAKKGVKQHIPLIIGIDGSSSVKSGRKEINLIGFPSGSGPAPFQGNWSIDNLREALDQATGRK